MTPRVLLLVSIGISIASTHLPRNGKNSTSDVEKAHHVFKRDVMSGGTPTIQDYLKIGHGILMTLSWGIFIVTGVMFARHFRGYETTYCGVKMWFSMHRALNTIGLVGMVLGTILIVVAQGGWTGPFPPFKEFGIGTLHSLLGALAVILAVIQPLNALLRCKPESRRRARWNWIHRTIGVTSFVLAMAAMVVATSYFNGMFGTPEAAKWTWILYLIILVASLLAKMIIYYREWLQNKDAPPDKIIFESDCARKWKAVTLALFLLSATVLSVVICVLTAFKPIRQHA